MSVTGVNHINNRTLDIASSVAFFVDIFGFSHVERPAVRGEPGNWLYDAAGNPIIHLRLKEPPGDSTGPIDHVALSCTNKTAIIQRLDDRKIPYHIGENLTGDGVTQVFFKDPHGIALELNFTD